MCLSAFCESVGMRCKYDAVGQSLEYYIVWTSECCSAYSDIISLLYEWLLSHNNLVLHSRGRVKQFFLDEESKETVHVEWRVVSAWYLTWLGLPLHILVPRPTTVPSHCFGILLQLGLCSRWILWQYGGGWGIGLAVTEQLVMMMQRWWTHAITLQWLKTCRLASQIKILRLGSLFRTWVRLSKTCLCPSVRKRPLQHHIVILKLARVDVAGHLTIMPKRGGGSLQG